MKNKSIAPGFFLMFLVFVCAPRLLADTLDPATLHIGPGAGTLCATGCGADPNLIGPGSTMDIFQNSGGASALSQPVFLILGVPNDTTNMFSGSPSSVTFYNPYPVGTTVTGSSAFATGGSSQWEMNTPTTNGGMAGTAFFGDMTSATLCAKNPCKDVYDFLNLLGDASNSFTNWAGADFAKDGISATKFGIYVFALNGANLGPNGLINISGFSAALPLGTFAVGWGCKTVDTSSCSSGDTFTTPFTEAGLTATSTTTPEPGTLLLLGTGLLGLAGLVRRRLT